MRGSLFIILGTLGGILLIGLVLGFMDLDWVHEQSRALNGLAVLLLMALLPLIGVPASLVYVVGGARFGPLWGMVLASVTIAFQLLASWWIAHGWLRRPLEGLFRRWGRTVPSIPQQESVPICLLVALLPGISYTLKNYLLVLTNVPFREFFWTCLPAHTFSASLAVLFGGFTGSMTTGKTLFLIAYALFVLGLSRYVVLRLRQRRLREDCDPLV